MKTPKILWSAIRQYRHNYNDGIVFGFDERETLNIVTTLQKRIAELEDEIQDRADTEASLVKQLMKATEGGAGE